MISPEFRLRAFVARLRGFLRGHGKAIGEPGAYWPEVQGEPDPIGACEPICLLGVNHRYATSVLFARRIEHGVSRLGVFLSNHDAEHRFPKE